VDLEKGEILVLDFSIEGKDASFYLTYSRPYSPTDGDYIEKKEHAVVEHIEHEAENTGLYYLNFHSTGQNQGTFQANLEYEVRTRFTPTFIIMGITALIVGIGLAVFYLWWRKKPHMMEDEFIRL
jgi:hypothetical protein